MTEIQSILAALNDAVARPAALATLVSVRGSSYRRPGARTLLLPDGSKIGTISGGCLEEDISLHLQQVLESGGAQLVTYDTTDENDLIWGVGSGCRGVVQVLVERISTPRPHWIGTLTTNLREGRGTELLVRFAGATADRWGTCCAEDFAAAPDGVFRERIEPAPRLILFGAGNDAMPLAHLAHEVGWRVTVVDSRPALVAHGRFPEADAIVVTSPASMDEHVELDPGAFVVIMSHRYQEDLSLLRILLGRPLAYLGVLGSKHRADRLLAELKGQGAAFDPNTMGNLCAPIGLDLGADTPATIALSILAEMQCRLTGRTPKPLRDRLEAIHG